MDRKQLVPGQRNSEAWLRKHLKLPGGIPPHDTLGRLLVAFRPVAFQKCFEAWGASITLSDEGTDLNQIAINGKVLRRKLTQP